MRDRLAIFATLRVVRDSSQPLRNALSRLRSLLARATSSYVRAVGIRVLVVDDLERNLVALEATLRAPGREIVCAGSGIEALAEASRLAIDLAVLDVMMPGMNGIMLAEALRCRVPELPLIFVSAVADEQEVQFAARRLGALGCFLSPIAAETLRGVVATFERQRVATLL